MTNTLAQGGEMSHINISNGHHEDDDELSLGMPDASEAQDLERHVSRCGLRFRLLAGRIRTQGKATKRIEYILYGVAVWLFATSPFAQDMLKRLMGVQ